MAEPTNLNRPLRQLAADLEAGRVTARELVEASLAAMADPDGEGSVAFLSVAAERARSEADAIDQRRREGVAVPHFAGIPLAIKDLADVASEVTTAGSVVLADAEPATVDAPAVARLRDAGFVAMGRTNMTEFAFSGLGLNPHFGTPRSPWDRATGRIAGGSSSGSAVAVADGMTAVGLGTDTGGSCRIPAAFCNIVGFKPTARRVPLDGIVPLAPSFDSVGPLANSVDCVAVTDALMAGEPVPNEPDRRPATSIRLGLVTNVMMDDLDGLVARRFEAALSTLGQAGVSITEVDFVELNELDHINRSGGLAPAEALAWHRTMIAERGDRYDQRVRRRIEGGAAASAVDYIEVLGHRRRLIERMGEWGSRFDALIAPTVAMIPPPVDSFPADGDPADPNDRYYTANNRRALRNTSIGNFLDCCAISLPLCQPDDRSETPAVGFMMMGPSGRDHELLTAAAALEPICRTVG